MPDQPVIDTHSPTWRAVKAWAEKRLVMSRAALEATGYPLPETEYQRGRIAALRELLALTEPKIHAAHSTTDHVE